MTSYNVFYFLFLNRFLNLKEKKLLDYYYKYFWHTRLCLFIYLIFGHHVFEGSAFYSFTNKTSRNSNITL